MTHWRVIVTTGVFLAVRYTVRKNSLANMTGLTKAETDDDDVIIHTENAGGNESLGRVLWSDSYSPDQLSRLGLKIFFQTVDQIDYQLPDWYSRPHICPTTAVLPPSLVSERRNINSRNSAILDFSTIVSTNLKIIFVGDSVSGQFSEMFDAAVRNTDKNNHILIKENFQTCVTVFSPVKGGGVTAFWRIHGTLSRELKTSSVICSGGCHRGIWGESQLSEILSHTYSLPRSLSDGKSLLELNQIGNVDNPPREEGKFVVGAFDAVIMRLPFGWMDLEAMTKEAIIEGIISSNEILGAETVIISTLPFDNNVKSLFDWEEVSRINQMVRDIAMNWKPPADRNSAVRWVLVQEFGNFTNQVLWKNGQHIGYNLPTPDFSRSGWEQDEADFLFERLDEEVHFPRSIPALCSNIPPKRNASECIRSKISFDGKHWCTDTLGARYSASVACLLGCVYNKILRETDKMKVRRCEQACNGRFMSLEPLETEWLEAGNVLFSRIPG